MSTDRRRKQIAKRTRCLSRLSRGVRCQWFGVEQALQPLAAQLGDPQGQLGQRSLEALAGRFLGHPDVRAHFGGTRAHPTRATRSPRDLRATRTPARAEPTVAPRRPTRAGSDAARRRAAGRGRAPSRPAAAVRGRHRDGRGARSDGGRGWCSRRRVPAGGETRLRPSSSSGGPSRNTSTSASCTMSWVSACPRSASPMRRCTQARTKGRCRSSRAGSAAESPPCICSSREARRLVRHWSGSLLDAGVAAAGLEVVLSAQGPENGQSTKWNSLRLPTTRHRLGRPNARA
jgi:hypothetical protein